MKGIVMYRLVPPLLLGSAAALFFLPVLGGAHAVSAQESTFNAERPIASLHQAAVASDSQRVELATALLKARADTEISHATYEDGVWYFLKNHPEFYGNFFGDPYYATYDTDYFKTARLRYLAGLEVLPFEGLSTLFFCDPLSYDPAFGCTGFTYTASAFLEVPLRYRRPLLSRTLRTLHQSLWSERPSPAQNGMHSSNGKGPQITKRSKEIPLQKAHAISTAERPDTADKSLSEDVGPISIDRARLPEDLHASMQEKASSLKRAEIALLTRQLKEQWFGNRDLSARERAEFASTLARTLSEENGLSRLRELSRRPKTSSSFPNRKRPTPTQNRSADRSRNAFSPTGRPNSPASSDPESPSQTQNGQTSESQTSSQP